MFSWLVIVSFIVAILFFGMFPRTDAFKTVDKPIASYYADVLVAQHLATWQAAVVKDLSLEKAVYVNAVSQGIGVEREAGNASFMTLRFQSLMNFLPPGWNKEMSSASEFKSVLLCVDNETGKFLTTCAVRYEGTVKKGTSDYLLTYAVLPNTESDLAKRQLGEKVFLTKYNRGINVSRSVSTETRTETGGVQTNTEIKSYDTQMSLRVQCGELSSVSQAGETDFQPGSSYYISNTRYSTVTVPTTVAKWLIDREGTDSILLCMTRLFETYDTSQTPAKLIYPQVKNN